MSRLEEQQKKFVLSLLSTCSSWKYKKANEEDDASEPREVKHARALIAKFEKKKQARRAKQQLDYERKSSAIRQEIYFGDVTKALKLAEALKKECGE